MIALSLLCGSAPHPAHAADSPYLYRGYDGGETWFGPFDSGTATADAMDARVAKPSARESCIAAGEVFSKIHWTFLFPNPEPYWNAGNGDYVTSNFISQKGCHTGGANYSAGTTHTANAGIVYRYNCPAGSVFVNRACAEPVLPVPQGPMPCTPCDGNTMPYVGNPILVATGTKFQREVDSTAGAEASALSLERFYNGDPQFEDLIKPGQFGSRWRSRFDQRLTLSWKPLADLNTGFQCWKVVSTPGSPSVDIGNVFCVPPASTSASGLPVTVSMTREDGSVLYFSRQNLAWISKKDVNDVLTASYNADRSAVLGWVLTTALGDTTKRFDANGTLLSISARNGRTQKFTYGAGTTNDTSVARVPADAPVCSHVQSGAVLPAGTLVCVTDSYGQQLQFEHDSQGRISMVFDPANQQLVYGYDGPSAGCTIANTNNPACSANNLTSLMYPDGSQKVYWYNEATQINGGKTCLSRDASPGVGFGTLLHALTGITDENGVRYATWSYDCSGRATSSEHAGGVEKVTVSFQNSPARTIVTDALGAVRTYRFANTLGNLKSTGMDLSASANTPAASTTISYDGNGNVLSTTDFNGNLVTHAYDTLRNLEISRVVASGTPQARTTSTEWHPTFRLPTRIAEPKLRTTLVYDTSGNLLTRSLQATADDNGSQGFDAALIDGPRTWTYAYNSLGQMLSIAGPRTDLVERTVFAYDTQGNLATVTNAKGQVTRLTEYDANGRLLTMIDPNGAVTTMTYSPRGWLTRSTVQSTDGNDVATTRYGYDRAGQIKTVTFPDSSTIDYTYDNAHRLNAIADSVGNTIAYTLDTMGNRVKETAVDPGGVLTRSTARSYDVLNRLQKVTGAVQ